MPVLSLSQPSTTAISNFGSGHGWSKQSASGTWADDVGTSSPNASQTLKITTDGSATITFGDLAISPSIDLSDSFPVLWIKVDDSSKIGDIGFFIDDDSGNFSNYSRLTVSSQQVNLDNTWIILPVSFSLDNPSGSPDRSAIDKIRLRFQDDGTGPVNIWLGGLHYASQNNAGYVTFEFDDGHESVYNNAYPILDAEGFVGSVPIIPSLVGTANYMTEAQINELLGKGWDVSCHDVTTMAGKTEAQVKDQGETIQSYIRARGWQNASHFIYPTGAYDANTIAGVSTIASSGRSTAEAPTPGTGLFERFQLTGELVVNTTTVAHITDQVDAAVTNKEWIRLIFHRIVPTATINTEYATANFQSVVTHVAGASVSVNNLSEMLGQDTGAATLDPSILKYGMILDDSTLKPGLVNETYTTGTGTSDTLKAGALDSEGNLKPGLLDADGNIKPGALR